MNGVVVEIRVPVTVPYVKVTRHNDCFSQVSNIVA